MIFEGYMREDDQTAQHSEYKKKVKRDAYEAAETYLGKHPHNRLKLNTVAGLTVDAAINQERDQFHRSKADRKWYHHSWKVAGPRGLQSGRTSCTSSISLKASV